MRVCKALQDGAFKWLNRIWTSGHVSYLTVGCYYLVFAMLVVHHEALSDRCLITLVPSDIPEDAGLAAH